jgi:hypothetical protein
MVIDTQGLKMGYEELLMTASVYAEANARTAPGGGLTSYTRALFSLASTVRR